MSALKILVLIFAIFFSVGFFYFLAICITAGNETPVESMGNEAYGYYSFFRLVAIVLAVPSIVLWLVYYLGFRKKEEINNHS